MSVFLRCNLSNEHSNIRFISLDIHPREKQFK